MPFPDVSGALVVERKQRPWHRRFMIDRPWAVYRPGPLTQRADGVWTVDDDVPGLSGVNRRMTVVRRGDGSLVFYNAVPMPDAVIESLKTIGKPTALIVPNRYHSLDVAAFAQRLGVEVYLPAVAVPVFAGRVACKAISEFNPGDDVRVFSITAFKTDEIALLVRETLIVADVLTNVPHGPGFSGLMMRLVGFTGPHVRVPRPPRWRVGRSKPELKAVLEQLAAEATLTRIIPSHGAVFEGDVGAAIRHAAQTL